MDAVKERLLQVLRPQAGSTAGAPVSSQDRHHAAEPPSARLDGLIERLGAAQAQSLDRVRASMPIVRRLARQMMLHMVVGVELEDLIHVGTIALVEADRHYKPACGIAFATYARRRIRVAMHEELRAFERRASLIR